MQWLTGATVVLGLLAWDLSRPPRHQLGATVAVTGIRVYRHTAGPVLASGGVRCRFEPTCSVYAEACIQRFGLLHGGWLALKRVARCGPWTPAGTHDPPPEAAPL